MLKLFPYFVLLVVIACCSEAYCKEINTEKKPQQYIQVQVKNSPSQKEWKQYDTRTIDMVSGFKPYSKKVELDKYGGRTDIVNGGVKMYHQLYI
ncbi:MAG: hypothetical protein NTW93_03235 [Phycisphaerae bacterium]|nr:hypothetical protein [Phycisphaerae bacterium]